MKYTLQVTPRFNKEFHKLDNYTRKIIQSWIAKNILNCEDPRAKGKGLTGNRSGQWRYRIGDYRLICEIKDNELIILALSIGHRRNVYD
ncbi:MAG: type II toxin-antitoxin system RelE/ParE family toxin [Bacteroides sp.]|nr:type II toxin-antitoxin system RelE/ParE family toxin [Eubacterium sp.]MCM1417294.1 type II toxin-antitoxin system RelE/ParE family toxin [Roseburia sp.]MCM1461086.1 type II toxin-antitoxin system RelE/ParE family toxin [Bacteroides sp.]